MYKVIFFMVLLLSSCTTFSIINGRIYNLSNGEVTVAHFGYNLTGKGTIIMTTKDGENFSGEYTTVGTDSNIYGNLRYAHNSSEEQQGAGILIGDRGTTIDIQYTVSKNNNHGYGTGTDNKGNKYRIQF